MQKLFNDTSSHIMTRIGLGLFFLVFGLLKLIQTQWFVEGPYKAFYGLGFPLLLISIFGIIQIMMALAFFANKYTKYASWTASAMFLSTIIATLPKILSTFSLPPSSPPPGFLFFATVPLFFMALSEALRETND